MPYDYDPLQSKWRAPAGPMDAPAGGFPQAGGPGDFQQQQQPPDPRAQKDMALQSYMAQGGSGKPPAGMSTMRIENGPRGSDYLFGQQPDGGQHVQAMRPIGTGGAPGAWQKIDPNASGAMIGDLASKLELAASPPGLSNPMAELSRLYQESLAGGTPRTDLLAQIMGQQNTQQHLSQEGEKNRIAWGLGTLNHSPAGRIADFEKAFMAANPGASAQELARHQSQVLDYIQNASQVYGPWVNSVQFPGGPMSGGPPQSQQPPVSGVPASAAPAQPGAAASSILADQARRAKIGGEVDDWINDKGTHVDDLFTRLYRMDRANPGFMQQRGPDVIDAIENARRGATSQFMNPGALGGLPELFADTDTTRARAAMRHYMGKTKPLPLTWLTPGLRQGMDFAFPKFNNPHAGMEPIPGSPGAGVRR
jgi:hypothetical protein